jgi:ribosomal-protein-alanine N-acetyltransferase
MIMATDHAKGNQEPLADVSMRLMLDGDVSSIMQIEVRAYPFPWTAGIFRDCIRAGYSCHVLLKDGKIAAYVVMSIGAREAHILNICVCPEQRGKGYGRIMMHKMIALARQLQVDMMFLEVRPSNTAARRLYEKLGFNEVGIRDNYYPAEQGREDALLLAMQL